MHTPRALLLLIVSLFCGIASAQFTPAANAVKLADSLVCGGATALSHMTLVYHPSDGRYYSARIGNSSFPLYTWLASGGTSIFESTTGLDTRGLWYNPNTDQIERNCFANVGWGPVDVDGGLNAVTTTSLIFAGLLQPNTQSIGAYDWNTNTVLFYDSGNLYVYSRATGLLTATIPLSGTSLTNVNQFTVIYTGQTGYEVGLLDYSVKKILLFSRVTGAFTGSSQLPAAAVTHSQFRWAYTNNRVWLWNVTLRKWNAYCIWNESCPVMLPVELINFAASCDRDEVLLEWSTGSERNSGHFIIERSRDAREWRAIGHVLAAGNSQSLLEYRFSDPDPEPTPVVYYRLREVDLDGTEQTSSVVALHTCAAGAARLTVYPNPSDGILHLSADLESLAEGFLTLDLLDATGRSMHLPMIRLSAGNDKTDLDLRELATGVYLLILRDQSGERIGQVRVERS